MKNKLLVFALVAIMICSFCLIACGGGGGTGGKNEYDIEIRMFLNNGNYFDGADKNSIWKELEKAAGAEIIIEGAGRGDYNTTLFPMINTLDVPDVFFMTTGSEDMEAYIPWTDPEDGILWNFDDIFAMYPGEYPYLEELINSAQYRNLRYNGQHTLLPNPSVASGWGIYYRADWLKNVGYTNADGTPKVPTNMDEFYEVMKLFTYNDPDGNGQNDTFGLSPGASPHFFNIFMSAFGFNSDWHFNENEEVEFGLLHPKMKNLLAWLQKCFDEGLIDPAFNTNSNDSDREDFEDSRMGIIVTNANDHTQWVAVPVMKLFGDESVIMGPAPRGTKNIGEEGCGGFTNWGGLWGGFNVAKHVTGDKLKAVLKLLDYCYSPEGSMTKTFGIKGVHYESFSPEEGIVITEENIENRMNEPEGTFWSQQQADGTFLPLGNCQYSGMFGSGPLDWDKFRESGAMSFFGDFSSSIGGVAGVLSQDAEDYMYYNNSNLLNITYPSSITVKNNKVMDLAGSFFIKAVLKQVNLTSDWDKLMQDVADAGWADVQRVMKETALELGIEGAPLQWN